MGSRSTPAHGRRQGDQQKKAHQGAIKGLGYRIESSCNSSQATAIPFGEFGRFAVLL